MAGRDAPSSTFGKSTPEQEQNLRLANPLLCLAICFGLPAQFWLSLRNEYDLRLAAVSPPLKSLKPRAA
jgi:hypothetical protein